MLVNNGYLIPDNPSPADNRCVRVYVPNDPLYMAALLGTLTYLGQWTAWKKDAEKRGKLAANAWKESNDLTLDGLSLPCGDNPITEEEMGDILDKLEEINSRLTEIEKMNVTVTQTVNGGCGEGSTTTTTSSTGGITTTSGGGIVTTPDGGIVIKPDDTGSVPPPYNTDTVDTADTVRCRAANYFVYRIVYMLRGLANMGNGGVAVVTLVMVIAGVVTWLSPMVGDEVITTAAFFAWAKKAIVLISKTGFAASSFNHLADSLESAFEEFVCTLYSYETSAGLGDEIDAFINAHINELADGLGLEPETVTLWKSFINSVIGPEMVNWFVDHVSTIVPAEFTPQYDCRCGTADGSAPDENVVTAGTGSLPSGDLSGTSQDTAAEFIDGWWVVSFELEDNYCVDIDYGDAVPDEEHHQTYIDGQMVDSDGGCIRKFYARSLRPFAAAVTFNQIDNNCDCVPVGATMFDHTFTYDADFEEWVGSARFGWHDHNGGQLWSNPRTSKSASTLTFTEAALLSLLGYDESATVRLQSVELDMLVVNDDGKTMALFITDSDGDEHEYEIVAGHNNLDGYFVKAGTTSVAILHFVGSHNGSDHKTNEMFLDNIRIRGWFAN